MLEAKPGAKQLIIPAFDHLNLTIGDMWKLPFYVPVLYHNYREVAAPESDESDYEANPKSSSQEGQSSIAAGGQIRTAAGIA